MKKIFIVLLIVIAGIFSGEVDTILFTNNRAWFNTEWWTKLLWQQPFYIKYFLPFAIDGFHFTKFMFLLSMFSAISLAMNDKVKGFLIWFVVLGLVYSVVFNLSYLL